MSTTAPFIRPYNPSTDYPSVLNVFHATLPPTLHREPTASLSAYLYCIPYLHLTPQTCFVLDDGAGAGAGEVVGYIIGTEGNEGFVRGWRGGYMGFVLGGDGDGDGDGVVEMLRRGVREGEGEGDDAVGWIARVFHEPEEALLFKGIPGFLEEYSGHFHIDILPTHQRRGYGAKLLTVFLQKIKDLGATGCHVVPTADNVDARRFYEREGFRPYPGVLDEGVSGEVGRMGNGTVVLVRGV
ncbi:hypothetical protein FQN50_003369 [Emmonsiellopsis sp. PD_5]|nr:hypothetical protein FQN50_003369 [Emmonsiellopsis sp. PD_5]